VKFIFIFLLIGNISFASEWNISKKADNLVKFTSSTSLLDFEGTTNNVDGYIYWDGSEAFTGKNEVYFEVYLNSVKTGNGKRDRDMREDVLETQKWSITYFKGNFKQVEKKENQNYYSVILVGKMFLHGIENEMVIPGKITIDENLMTVESNYSIFLKNFNIEAPSLLAFVKVAEEIKLDLKFYLEQHREDNN